MDVECWLEIIIGPVFSSKSSELIRRLEHYEYAGYPTVLIKPVLDPKDSKKVVTHSGLEKSALTIKPTYEEFMELEEKLKKVEVFGIDDFQFFEDSDELVSEISDLANEKRVYIASLNFTFLGEPWPATKRILPCADHYTSLEAICTYKYPNGNICGNKATRSQRLTREGNLAPSNSPLILIGGKYIHEARCKTHYTVPPLC